MRVWEAKFLTGPVLSVLGPRNHPKSVGFAKTQFFTDENNAFLHSHFSRALSVRKVTEHDRLMVKRDGFVKIVRKSSILSLTLFGDPKSPVPLGFLPPYLHGIQTKVSYFRS